MVEASIRREPNLPGVFRLPAITLFSLVLELCIVAAASLVTTSPYMDFSTNVRVAGGEAEYLMASVYTATTAYQKLGYLPLWQPWLEKGEPLLSNPSSMLFNPIGSWPSFLIGPVNGTKLSMILFILFSGLGGWVLGRVLGLRAPARVLLGVLCVARGSLHGVLVPGFFPFAMSQAHFPWVFAGAISVLWFRQRRWPIVFTAVMFTLMFWIGLLWYLPAVMLAIGLLTLFHCVSFRSRLGADNRRTFQAAIDWTIIRRMAATALLTVALSAIVLFPLYTFRNNIGQSSVASDNVYALDSIVNLYFDGSLTDFFGGRLASSAYYSFISPWWFVGLLTVGVIAVSFLRRSKNGPVYPYMLRWMVVAVAILIVFFTLWGAGMNPLINWAYDAIPLARSFRHVERVLALGAFWVGVLVAIAVDYIWYQLRTAAAWRTRPLPTGGLAKNARGWLAVGLVAASVVASVQALSAWFLYGWPLEAVNTRVDACLAGLRSRYPDAPLSVWTKDYSEILSYLKYEIRHAHVQTDFYKPSPVDGTLYTEDIAQLIPEFGQTWGDWENTYIPGMGYQHPMEGLNDIPGFPCFYTTDSYYPYAFWVPVDWLHNQKLTPEVAAPIITYKRNYDWVAVVADGSDKGALAVVIQELAFPGWTVQVNGAPANLEVVGGFIGVALPANTARYDILFQYRPASFFSGAALTLLSVLFCILYLLRAERLVPPEWRTRLDTTARAGYARMRRVMLNPDIMGTEEIPHVDLFGADASAGPKLLPPPAPVQPEEEKLPEEKLAEEKPAEEMPPETEEEGGARP